MKQIRAPLEAAASLAKAAHIGVQAGNAGRAMDIAIDLDRDLREAKRMFDATLMVSRCTPIWRNEAICPSMRPGANGC